jgi:hypothetical protein
VVPASTDLALFQASQPPPGGGMVVAAACSLSPWEDVATLLDAVGRLPPHLGVRLVLSLASAAGPGESAGPADIPTQPRGTPGWVEVRPPLLDPADVAAMLAEADVVAVPLAPGRRNAEAGHTLHRIAEALAAGRALVAPDLPAVREAVDADTALLYPPGDAAALARALEELAADPDRRMDMGLKARERAEDRYADAVVAEPLLALYRELLEPSVMLAPELMGPAAPPSDGTHAFEDLTDPDATAHPVPFSGHLADDTTNKHRTAPPPPSFSGPLASDDTSRAVGSQPAAASPAPKLPRDEPDTDPASRVS